MVRTTELARVETGSGVWAVAFSPDGLRVVAGNCNGETLVLEAATGTVLARHHRDTWVMAVAFSPDGTQVAVGNHDGLAQVLDARTGRERARHLRNGSVTFVAFSPTGVRSSSGPGRRPSPSTRTPARKQRISTRRARSTSWR